MQPYSIALCLIKRLKLQILCDHPSCHWGCLFIAWGFGDRDHLKLSRSTELLSIFWVTFVAVPKEDVGGEACSRLLLCTSPWVELHINLVLAQHSCVWLQNTTLRILLYWTLCSMDRLGLNDVFYFKPSRHIKDNGVTSREWKQFQQNSPGGKILYKKKITLFGIFSYSLGMVMHGLNLKSQWDKMTTSLGMSFKLGTAKLVSGLGCATPK